MNTRRRLDIASVSGDAEEVGFRLGRKYKKLGGSMLSYCKARYRSRGISWQSVLKSAGQFLPYAEDYSPSYVEMMRGYARGSGLAFNELFVNMCGDEKGMCTDIALSNDATADGSVLSAHTEDWREEDQDHLAMVRLKRKGAPAYLAITFGGLEVIGGVNEAGISVTVNSLAPNDIRVGVPKTLVAHEVLSCNRLDRALRACVPAHRGSGYNYNICHRSGEIVSVETSATDFSALPPRQGCLVHTNHYLDPRMHRYETLFSQPEKEMMGYAVSTVVRFNRARRLVRKMLGSADINGLVEVLKDHVNYPDSICGHIDRSLPQHARTKTIYSEVIDVSDRSIWLGLGNPCKSKFHRYDLDA